MSHGKVLTPTLLLLGLVLVLAIPTARQCPAQASAPAAAQPAQWSKRTGPELIQALLADDTRLAAFRELARRAGEEDADILNSAEVLVCPQGEGKKPIYAVVTNWVSRARHLAARSDGFPVEKPEELFGPSAAPGVRERPLRPHGKLDRWYQMIVYGFKADGAPARHRGLLSVCQGGMVGDVNGDGFVEEADPTSYGETGFQHAQTLNISAILDTDRPVLTVLYNLGDREDWDYQLVDRDNDGVLEIEFGPIIGADGAIKSTVIFAWDKAQKRYVSPQGEEGPHFRVLRPNPDDIGWIWKETARLKAAGISFAPDPESTGKRRMPPPIRMGEDVDEADATPAPPAEPEPPAPPPPPRPYRYASLKGLTREQLRAYMGRGAEVADRPAPPSRRLPENLWTMPPKDAAVAFVDAIRPAADRARNRLAVDDRDGKKPPETCTVYYSYASPGDYMAGNIRCFLRADPVGSYFAYSRAEALGWVLRPPVDARPSYDLRRVDLGYDEARRISDVLWYLNRVRSSGGGSHSYFDGWSSADGDGAFIMSSPRGREIDLTGRIAAFWPAGRGRSYGPQDLVNLAYWLLCEAVPDRLGDRWKAQEPAPELDRRRWFAWEPGDAKENPEETAKRATAGASAQVARLIGLFSADQSRLAHYLLLDAVQVAGDFALAEYVPLLKAMQKELPAPAKPVRTAPEVEGLMHKAFEAEKTKGDSLAARDDSIKLMEEWQILRHGAVPESAKEELRQAVELALRKIDAADDLDRVSAWARSRDEGWRWALLRLKQKDRKRYAVALEWWIDHSEGEWARKFFDEIRWVDPERARVLAARVAADGPHPLTIPAYSVLDTARTITDRDKRIDALIAVALDPKSGWDQRREAVELLVPPGEPLRYPDRRIDDALAKLLDPALADEGINGTLKEACRALARRGRIEFFDRIAAALPAQNLADPYDEILSSLVLLAQSGGPEHHAKLLGIIAPELKESGRTTVHVVECAYGADLRELKSDVARVATLSPEDCESPYTSCSEPRPVTGRWHIARKVAAIWNEEDPLTRGRLLIAFGLEERRDEHGPAVRATRGNLQELAKTLPPADANLLIEFVAWCEKERVKSYKDVDPRTEFGNFVRTTFAATH